MLQIRYSQSLKKIRSNNFQSSPCNPLIKWIIITSWTSWTIVTSLRFVDQVERLTVPGESQRRRRGRCGRHVQPADDVIDVELAVALSIYKCPSGRQQWEQRPEYWWSRDDVLLCSRAKEEEAFGLFSYILIANRAARIKLNWY